MPALGLAVCILRSTAAAVDVPVPGRSLSLRTKDGRETLAIRLSDPAIPLVASGPDDPSVAGLSLELFGGGPAPETAALFVPSGVGDPGWTVQSVGRYRYKNDAAPAAPSPVRRAGVRAGKIQLAARAIGLTLDGARASIGVRIQIGDLRVCALFAGASVRRDETGRFTARNAVVAELQDCSDQALTGLPCGSGVGLCGGLCPAGHECAGFPGSECECIAAAQPCGDTAPACNGECPAGQECANLGGVPYYGCGCLPAGSTGCGTTYPTCGGDCPAGLACFADTFTCCGGATISGCTCATGPPPPPCGGPCPPGTSCNGAGCYPIPCAGDGSCPAGATCVRFGDHRFCSPTGCSGGTGYPTCEGTCAPGLACTSFVQDGGGCWCAP